MKFERISMYFLTLHLISKCSGTLSPNAPNTCEIYFMKSAVASGGVVTKSGNHAHCPGHEIDSTSSWCSYSNNTADIPWIQMASPGNIQVTWTAIITQGRYNVGQWVTAYKVAYSTNGGTTWTYYNSQEILTGNTDPNTHITQYLKPPLNGNLIRIYPYTWNGWRSMRVEAIYSPL